MRPQSRSASRHSRAIADEDFFERKARELVVPDDEIEAWELDGQDLGGFRVDADCFNASGSE
jgi:hypothetical protein